NRTTVADNIPSSQTNPGIGSLVSGVADVAFVDGNLYGILAGAGCSHGVPSIPNGVIRVHRDGSWTLIADLSAYVRANPVAHPNADDFEPDGTWYSMIAVDDALYAVEPNHGEVDRITTHGKISRLIDVSASQGHVVPTVIARRDGNFYLGNLGRFPQDAGSSNIWKITPRGQISLYATGFNMVLGLTFDRRGRMYVLQNSEAPAPAPGTGSVVRLSRDGGHRTVLVNGLFFHSSWQPSACTSSVTTLVNSSVLRCPSRQRSGSTNWYTVSTMPRLSSTWKLYIFWLMTRRGSSAAISCA